VHRRALLVAVVAAVVASLAAVAAPGAAPAPAPSDATLLRRHLPILELHPAEGYPPVAVDAFLAASDQLVRRPDGTFTAAAAGETPTRLDVRACTVAQGPAGIGCYAGLATGPPTVYGAVHRRAGRIVVQYWFFEPVNLWSPAVPAAANAWQAHEGDWEHIAIVLDARGTPLQAGYAQHCRGVRTPWSRVPRYGRTQRPLVYVGLGSHASYLRRGVQATDPRCWPDPQVVLSIFRALGYRLVDHAGGGRRITAARLVRLTSTSPSWTGFFGTWGEDRYARLGDATFKDGAGPIGPTHKREWRDPVATVASWPLAR
jgi:hypothetical protein